jgi:hydrogenase nickel incorporation protein HypB
MCTTCGCGNAETRIEGNSMPELVGSLAGREAPSHASVVGERYRHAQAPDAGVGHGDAHGLGARNGEHWHQHSDGTWHSHIHNGDGLQHGRAHVAQAPWTTQDATASASRTVQVERDLLAKNDSIAAENRRAFADRGVFALNLVSSPGSGKTTLLVKTIGAWEGRTPVAVIEGDQQTSRDADRVREAGAPAVQINTGKGCHLDAQMVADALSRLALADDSLLLIENVGNLVCPAAFDLGEAHKVVVLSVTEGDDKPLKYPDMFHAADLIVLNKIDLLPHVEFDVAAAIDYARRVRPGIEVITLSARTGEGFTDWLAWLERGVARARARRENIVEALRRRVAALESELALSTTVR